QVESVDSQSLQTEFQYIDDISGKPISDPIEHILTKPDTKILDI
ncbi:2419_t:CDS:2, partial [Gigaspora margarita]